MKIIGLAGTNGSGKDTVGHMLAERHGYLFVSGSDMLRDEATKRGLPHEREYLRAIGNEWRREHGAGVLVVKAAELAEKVSKNLGIASIRSIGEVDEIHQHGGVVVWVDADPQVRYARINRGDRDRVEDNKTYEQFLREEAVEMNGSDDDSTLNMSAVKKKSDIVLDNSGSDIDSFKAQAIRILKDYI